MTTEQIFWLSTNIINTLYLLGLSLFLLRKWNMPVRSEEDRNIREIKRAVGTLILVCGISFLIYMLPTFIHGWGGDKSWDYALCFFVSIILGNPVLRWTLHALLQNSSNLMRGFPFSFIPEVIVLVWFFIKPEPELQTEVASIIVLISLVTVFIAYYSGYRRYMRNLRAEYSYLTNRDLRWTLKVFAALFLIIGLFVLDEYITSIFFDIIYNVVFLATATYIVYSANKSLAVSAKINLDRISRESALHPITKEQADDITHKLRIHCEDAELYLDPELTCDSLSEKIGYDRNMLIQYFTKRHINYFMYINNLRIDYACSLMDEESEDVVIKDIAHRSGFSSTRAFIDAYKEVMDYIPVDDEDENEDDDFEII